MSDVKALKEKVKNLKVLFVDDEKDVRSGTGTFLRKFFDDVVVCENGKEGLEIFSETRDFDIVITDLLMPVMDGLEMSREIRKLNPNTFIIVLTASRGTKDLEKEVSDITLKKPLSFEDMLELMSKLEEK